MLICVGLAADPTFVHSVTALKRAGVAFDVVDIAQLAYSGSFEINTREPRATTIALHAEQYLLGSYAAALVRLVDVSDAAPTDPLKHRAAGIYHAFCRFFSVCGLPTINPPMRDNSNFAKLYHAVALASGTPWQIPRSCLTNDRDEALRFIAECEGNVIFKGASGVKTWATRYLQSVHEERLDWLPLSPVLFQECIEGPDVRVHVVGTRLFAEVIESSEIDYRHARNNTYRQIQPPSDIADGCIHLVADMRVPFLGVDFKIDARTGAWYFLEANSLPCYEGYDRRAGGAISRAIVDWLRSPDTAY